MAVPLWAKPQGIFLAQPLRKARRTNCSATALPLPARVCEAELGANQAV